MCQDFLSNFSPEQEGHGGRPGGENPATWTGFAGWQGKDSVRRKGMGDVNTQMVGSNSLTLVKRSLWVLCHGAWEIFTSLSVKSTEGGCVGRELRGAGMREESANPSLTIEG